MTLAFGAFMNFFKLCLSFSITLSGLVLFQPHSGQGAPVSERFFGLMRSIFKARITYSVNTIRRKLESSSSCRLLAPSQIRTPKS